MSPETAEQFEAARAAKRAMLAELGAAVRETHRECPILQALHVSCGAFAIDATTNEVATADQDYALVLHDGSGLR